MTALLAVLYFAFACVALVFVLAEIAPEGHEDEHGYHAGKGEERQ